MTADALQGGALRCSNCTEGFMTHGPILRNKDNSICSKEISDLQQNVLSILFVRRDSRSHDGCKVTAPANHPDVPSKSVAGP